MTVAIFEAATIKDVIKRVEKAAPRVADTADSIKTAGILIDVQPASQYAVIRATNEKVYYREIVDLAESDGERCVWLLSSSYLAKMIETFKSNSGSFVRFAQVGGLVEITQDRKKAKLGLMSASTYPDWYESDIAGADEVTDLGAKIKLIEWASDSATPALNGIYVTREWLYATNKYVMARVPCGVANLPEPITLEGGLLNGLIDQRGELLFKVIGGQVLISPNDRTQIRTPTIGEPFPPVERAMRFEYPEQFTVNRDEFLKLVNTTRTVEGKNKSVVLRLFIGDGQVAGICEQDDDPSTGIRDIIDVSGAQHEMTELQFNPTFLGNAVSNAPDEFITLCYDDSRATAVVLVKTASNYQCWVTPIDGTKRRASA